MNNKIYAVLRVDKITNLSDLASRSRHNLRQDKSPHTDPTRKNVLLGLGTVPEITKKWKDTTEGLKIKSNSVLAVEYLITTSNEFWSVATSLQKKEWAERSYKFVQQKHGAENILSAALHLDEQTPHWHILLIPIDTKPRLDKKTGKLKEFRGLNASAFFDGSDMMSKLQDAYHAKVGDLGLDRGIKGSKALHTTVKAFQKGINRASKPLPELSKADHAAAMFGRETPTLKSFKKGVTALQWASKAPSREKSAMQKVKELAKAKREAEEAKTEAEKDKVRADARCEALKRETFELKQQLSQANEIILEKDSALESQAVELQFLKQKDSKVVPFARRR